jgi:hypothetical protein
VDGLLNISRIQEYTVLNDKIVGMLPGGPKVITTMPLKDPPFPLKMCIETPGMLNSTCMEIDELPGTEQQPDYVEIQVKASSIK